MRVSRWFSRRLSNEPIRSTTSWRAASSALLNRITKKIPIFSLFPLFYFFISYCYNYWILGFREEGRPLERSWIYRIVFLVFSGSQTERTSNSFSRVEMGASNSSSIDLPLVAYRNQIIFRVRLWWCNLIPHFLGTRFDFLIGFLSRHVPGWEKRRRVHLSKACKIRREIYLSKFVRVCVYWT